VAAGVPDHGGIDANGRHGRQGIELLPSSGDLMRVQGLDAEGGYLSRGVLALPAW
jgi:hypothetical protein